MWHLRCKMITMSTKIQVAILVFFVISGLILKWGSPYFMALVILIVFGRVIRQLDWDSKKKKNVCGLVAILPIEGADEKSKQLRKVIMRKNMAQYECRSVRKADADEMVKVTTRVYQWVKEKVKS